MEWKKIASMGCGNIVFHSIRIPCPDKVPKVMSAAAWPKGKGVVWPKEQRRRFYDDPDRII